MDKNMQINNFIIDRNSFKKFGISFQFQTNCSLHRYLTNLNYLNLTDVKIHPFNELDGFLFTRNYK